MLIILLSEYHDHWWINTHWPYFITQTQQSTGVKAAATSMFCIDGGERAKSMALMVYQKTATMLAIGNVNLGGNNECYCSGCRATVMTAPTKNMAATMRRKIYQWKHAAINQAASQEQSIQISWSAILRTYDNQSSWNSNQEYSTINKWYLAKYMQHLHWVANW